MKHSRSPRDLWASLLPLLGTALALLIASRIHALGADGPLPPWLLVVLIAAGAVAACHRPFMAASTVGLGTAVLPVALLLAGAVPAAGLAAAAVLASDLCLRFVRRTAVYSRPDRRSLLRSLESAGRAVLATIGAAGVWAWLHAGHGLLLTVPATAALYLALWIGLEIADSKIRRPDLPPRWRTLLPPLLLDAFGWMVGGAVAAVGGSSGTGGNWALAGGLLAGYAVLSLEAGRNRVLHERVHHRVRDLEKLRRAAKRMVGHSERELVEVIDRIRMECSKVVQASFWFQFEILIPGGELKSWWAGPQGVLQEGVPEPDRYPPSMPGVHRRTPWQILERQLRSDSKPLARIRLWCDPRRLDPQGVDLLDRLIHQASVSVQRCLAGREAREDALTGVAVRRVLERRLHEVHARCLEDGSSMAVVLCDLDHFKRINDTHGHPAGDAALVASAAILKKTEGALCCRYGGEEFVLLLDNSGGEAALAVAERVRQQIEALPFEWEGQRVPLTLSAGAACFPDLYIKTAAELILFADEALYEAKRRGRNRALLDIGQGRYLDPDGNVLATDEAHAAKEPPRIFA